MHMAGETPIRLLLFRAGSPFDGENSSAPFCFDSVALGGAGVLGWDHRIDKMARFSERIGVKPPKAVLQLSSMDDDLRNGLWNACYDHEFKQLTDNYFRTQESRFCNRLWRDFFKKPADDIPYGAKLLEFVKEYFFETAVWSDVYDLVEFTTIWTTNRGLVPFCNYILEREMSGYRFVGTELTPITNQDEMASVQQALELPAPLRPVRSHFQAAVALFSDRKSPDYRNSIKESISAVEAMCKIIIGDEKATLGQALKKLEEKGVRLHKALQNSFSSLYGYTNDADGIRHALVDESTADFDDAKFMLVSCSAFANYLAAKAAKAGVMPVK
jgi:hypothetical protein